MAENVALLPQSTEPGIVIDTEGGSSVGPAVTLASSVNVPAAVVDPDPHGSAPSNSMASAKNCCLLAST